MSGFRAAALVIAFFGLGSSAGAAPPLTRSGDELSSHDRFADLAVGEQAHVAGVRLAGGEEVELTLERFSVLAPDARLVVVDGLDSSRIMAPPEVVLLRGQVAGDPTSRVFLSISPFGTHGSIRTAGDVHVISSGPYPQDAQQPLSIAPAADLLDAAAGVPPCGTPHDPDWPVAGAGGVAGGGDPPCRVVRMAIDTDWEYTAGFNANTQASAAYAITLLGGASEIYTEAFNVRLHVGFLRVWGGDFDPYFNGGSQLHVQFRNHWNDTMGGVQRDLAHLLSGRNNLPYGGIAWIGGLCNQPIGYGVSGFLNGFYPYPLQDNHGANWDVVVVAHELGHNFGTIHTHDFSPPVDNCGNGDCSDAFDGTIMSYCHTCPGGMTNIALNFAPIVEQTIMNYLDSVSCNLSPGDAVATDDEALTLGTVPVIIDVLNNDVGEVCDPTEVSISGFDPVSAANGSVASVAASGPFGNEKLQYTAPPGFIGNDTFQYTLNTGGTATVTVDVETIHPAAQVGPLSEGVVASYYELDSPASLPDFTALTPASSAIEENVEFYVSSGDFAGSGMSDEVGAVFEGVVWISFDGLWRFFLESDDGSRLLIDDNLVVDNDGVHGMVEEDGIIGLAGGYHRFRIEFFENTGESGLLFSFQAPGFSQGVIPPWILFHETACPGDFDGDGEVGVADLVALLSVWDATGALPEDLDGDGEVSVGDLVVLIANWGECG